MEERVEAMVKACVVVVVVVVAMAKSHNDTINLGYIMDRRESNRMEQ